MHQHHLVLRGEGPQAGLHRGAALGTPGHDVDLRGTAGLGGRRRGHGARVVQAPGRGDDDDVPHSSNGQHAVEGVPQQRLAVQRDEGLGDSGPESHTATGGDQDDSDAQEARTSSRMASALSSLVFSASASSETRI